MGIELELFTLQDVAIHYQCMVCKDIPEMSISSLRIMCPAGHIVCHTCVDPNGHRPSKCYLCQQPVGYNRHVHGSSTEWLTQPQPAIERLIKDLEVKCSKHEDGCVWKGKCIDLRTHEKTKCEHRIEACKHAGRGCKFSASPPKVQAHHLNCEFRDTVCRKTRPWDNSMCGVTHRVNQTKSHESSDCIYHVCPYSSSGCRFSGKFRDVQDHQKKYCAEMHAKIRKLEAAIAQDTFEDEQKRIKKTVEKQVISYKKRIATLEKDLKLAQAECTVLKMQNSSGVPRMVGQGTAGPSNSSAGPNILLRMTSSSQIHSDGWEMSNAASEAAWNEAHWMDADWGQIDRQAVKVAKKTAMGDVTRKAMSHANASQSREIKGIRAGSSPRK